MAKIVSINIGSLIIFLFTLPPIYFWYPHSNFSNAKAILLSLGQMASLMGYVLLCINFVLSTRLKIFDRLFKGLNRMYITHHLVGVSAFILILLHPTLIITSYLLVSLNAAINLVYPSLSNIPVLLGITALDIMIVLLIITLYVKIEYNKWKTTHKYLGITLVLSSIHLLLIGSTVSQSLELKLYLLFFMIVGLTSYVYYSLFGKFTIPKRRFIVDENVNLTGDTIEISLLPPPGLRLSFNPGQFIFVSVDVLGIAKESRPFSIVSASNEDKIKLGIKTLGGYTNSLRLAKKGSKVLIEGPYGRFGYKYQKQSKQLWIAGGIGVTPFVSMAKSLEGRPDIVMLYSVKSPVESSYNKDLEDISKFNPNFKIILWDSSKRDRLTADKIISELPDSLTRKIYICGPSPMMNDLKKQFIKKGVSPRNVFTEEFSLN